MCSWLTSLIGKSSTGGTAAQPSGASLPPLPTGSVSAVADTLTEAGRIVEQQTALHNTPQMQQSVQAQAQQQRLEKVETDVANEDIDAMRRDVAD